MSAAAGYLIGGIALLVAVIVPTLLTRVALSAPIVLVVMGIGIGFIPFGGGVTLSPLEHGTLTAHLAEFTVLVALMGVALALDRPLRLRDRATLRAWWATWRLLGIAMPLGIGATALLAWWLMGVPPAVALLLGAVLSPTDPVLAADVQVEGPTTDQGEHVDEDDEVRFALTSEAGFNDALAFPFVKAAIIMAAGAPLTEWVVGWVAWEVVGKIVIGVLVGLLVGWGLGQIAFRSSVHQFRLADRGEPLLALAVILVSYGLAELVHGWGFLAVFVAGIALRSSERHHGYHEYMHSTIERLELLCTMMLLLLLGVALSDGLLSSLSWPGVAVGLTLLLVIRPLVGWLSLARGGQADRDDDRDPGDHALTSHERLAVSFFGVRGIGSVFYLAYALNTGSFDEYGPVLWSTVAFTIVASVLIHGVSATPVMRWLEARRAPGSAQHRSPLDSDAELAASIGENVRHDQHTPTDGPADS